MKISVAMTTYNGAKYIIPQLDSLLAQTRVIDQLVICDDCSQDKTVDIIREYFQQTDFTGLKLVVNDKNLGYIKNFYQAISLCEGDLIFLCDQDDIWCPEKIEIMTKLFEEHPEMSALNTSFCKIDANGVPYDSFNSEKRNNYGLLPNPVEPDSIMEISFEQIIWKNISPGCTMAFRSSLQSFFVKNATGFSPHDWELNVFASICRGLYYYNSPLIDYRIHDSNTLGMSAGKQSRLHMSTDQSKRVTRANADAAKARAYLSSEWVISLSEREGKILFRYARIAEQRAILLNEKRVDKWILALIVHFTDYRRMQGSRGIVGDLVYMIRVKKE